MNGPKPVLMQKGRVFEVEIGAVLCYNSSICKKEGGFLEFSKELRKELDAALMQVMNLPVRPYKIVPERYEALIQVCEELSEIFGTEAQVGITPRFTSGDASVRFTQFELDKAKVLEFEQLLGKCCACGITPYLNGDVEVSVTVEGILKRI